MSVINIRPGLNPSDGEGEQVSGQRLNNVQAEDCSLWRTTRQGGSVRPQLGKRAVSSAEQHYPASISTISSTSCVLPAVVKASLMRASEPDSPAESAAFIHAEQRHVTANVLGTDVGLTFSCK